MYGMMETGRESGLGSDSDNMAELAALINTEIPDGQNSLTESFHNLERVAQYCEGNYFQSDNKRYALEETKNYTTQSLASVAYQINTLAYNFLQLLDLQTSQLAEMESQMNHIAQTVMIHKEKVARREIGVLTANKATARQYKIIAPANPEKPIKYVRKPIDFNALDDVGHGIRSHTPRTLKSRVASQVSIGGVGPAPTTKPPTPPSVIRSTGSLSKGSREYRTPPAVAPPQVPSHYAPNYPVGHVRRTGGGYSTLPLASSATSTSSGVSSASQYHPGATALGGSPAPPPPITLQPNTPPPPPPALSATPPPSYLDHHSAMPPPPSPLAVLNNSGPERSSPPLPPPPAPLLDQEPPPPPIVTTTSTSSIRYGVPPAITSMPVVTTELDLPGWVPKNYIEKVVAIYDYYADKNDELSFQENAVIYVLKKNDDGWWEGVMDGITGLFPGNYVEPCV